MKMIYVKIRFREYFLEGFVWDHQELGNDCYQVLQVFFLDVLTVKEKETQVKTQLNAVDLLCLSALKINKPDVIMGIFIVYKFNNEE